MTATLEGGWHLIPNIRGRHRKILETAPCYAGPWEKQWRLNTQFRGFSIYISTELELFSLFCHARFL